MKSLAKKLCALVLCMAVCAVAALAAAAADQTITIKECDDLQITLPENMSVITRSTEPTELVFSNRKLDYNETMQIFEQKDIYMQAMSNEDTITVTLTCTENDASHKTGNYNKYSAADLEKVKNNYLTTKMDGVSYNAGTADEAGKEIVWLYFNFTAEDHQQYRAETVYRGKIIALTLMRNDSDVQPGDYGILTQIAQSVSIPSKGDISDKRVMLYIAVGAAALAIILLIVLIIVIKKASSRKKKTDNEKILQELAGKYQTRPATKTNAVKTPSPEQEPRRAAIEDEPQPAKRVRYDEEDFEEDLPRPAKRVRYEEDASTDDVPGRKYSDADIERLLGETEDRENFKEALFATEADFADDAEVRDSVLNRTELISDYFEGMPAKEEAAWGAAAAQAVSAYEAENPRGEETAPEAIVPPLAEPEVAEMSDETAGEEPAPEQAAVPDEAEEASGGTSDSLLEDLPAEDSGETLDDLLEDMPSEDFGETLDDLLEDLPSEDSGETLDDLLDDLPSEDSGETLDDLLEDMTVEDSGETLEDVPAEEPEGALQEEPAEAEDASEEEAEDDFREFVNDEVLAREESKQNRFKKSSDFFEEAPKKMMGVISSKEIEEAEEYDVIGEVEHRAEELEAQPKPKGEGFAGAVKKVGNGFKSFGIHCGYFATNVKRAVKRKRMKKKRQKAAEERRRRQIERRQQERAVRERQRDKNGLVQVHSRDDRRPTDDRR